MTRKFFTYFLAILMVLEAVLILAIFWYGTQAQQVYGFLWYRYCKGYIHAEREWDSSAPTIPAWATTDPYSGYYPAYPYPGDQNGYQVPYWHVWCEDYWPGGTATSDMLTATSYSATQTDLPIPTATNTRTPRPTITRTPTTGATPSETATLTPTFTETETATPTETSTNTPTETATQTSTSTATPTATQVASTFTPTPTNTIFPDPTNSRFIFYNDYQYWPPSNHQTSYRIAFMHRSVGQMIAWGIRCTMNFYPTAKECVPYRTDPYQIANFFDATFVSEDKINEFDAFVRSNINNYDVFMFKYCYLDAGKAWYPVQVEMERLSNEFPTKKFVVMTMPLLPMTTTVSTKPQITQFNHDLRWYAISAQGPKNLWFLDIANFEAYDPNGNYCLDAYGWESMCPIWQGGTNGGGHINKIGGEWIARAFWIMISRMEAH